MQCNQHLFCPKSVNKFQTIPFIYVPDCVAVHRRHCWRCRGEVGRRRAHIGAQRSKNTTVMNLQSNDLLGIIIYIMLWGYTIRIVTHDILWQ